MEKNLANILCIANQKGGVGKTSLCLNLGASLAYHGEKVLLVDLDPQANLSESFDCIERVSSAKLYEPGAVEAAVQVRENLWLYSAGRDLSELAEVGGESKLDVLFALKESLSLLRESYDFIILDTPPTLSGLTLSALVASTHLLIALSTQFYTLQGTKDLLKTYGKMQKRLNPDIKLLGVAVSMHDKRTALATEILEQVKADFERKVLEPFVPRTIKVEESQVQRRTVIELYPKSEVAEAYLSLAKRVMLLSETYSSNTDIKPSILRSVETPYEYKAEALL